MKATYLLLIALCALSCPEQAKATLYINDGGTHEISITVNDSISISNGSQISLVPGGAVSGHLRVEYDAGSFIMTGGSIGDNLAALSSEPIHISGGFIGNAINLDSSYGGGETGDVYIYGNNFKVNGDPVAYGTYRFGYPNYTDMPILSGILANGDPINCYVSCSGANDVILAPIPEPATSSLLALGFIALVRKRSKNQG